MITICADYHTHTAFSHGKGTPEQNVVAAIRMGLKGIAITDHAMGHALYGMRRREIRTLRREIDRLNKVYQREIVVWMGVEANLIGCDGELDVTPEEAGWFDLLAMGFHKGATPHSLRDFRRLYLSNLGRSKPALRNTQAYLHAMERYPIDVITHPGEYIPIDIEPIAQVARQRHTALEINAAHPHLNFEQIQRILPTGCLFIIGSDAHRPEDVGRMETAIALAREAEVPTERIVNSVGFVQSVYRWAR